MDGIKKEGFTLNLFGALRGIRLIDKRSEDITRAFEEAKRSLAASKIRSGSRDYNSIEKPKIVFGSDGKDDGQFNEPRNVAVDRDNNIIVCDVENRRIQMFDEDGHFIESERFLVTRNGVGRMNAASVDLDDNIVLFGWDYHQIIVYSPSSGKMIKRFGKKGSRDGGFGGPQSLCVDHLSRIIVCDTTNHRIQIFDPQGNHLLSFGSKGSEDGQFDEPQGVTVNHLNNIIVCERFNHRIQMFDEKGNHLLSFGSKGSENGQFDRPQRVAVDCHNNILVSDWGNNRIQVFDPQGKWISSFGSYGREKGQFDGPQGITVDHLSRIIVTDVNNSRVQIF